MKKINSACKRYLHEIKADLPCTDSEAHVIIKDIREKIFELDFETGEPCYEELCEQLGTPAEVARGFGCTSIDSSIKKRAKRYFKVKILAAVLAVLLVAVTTFTVIIIKEASGRKIVVSDAYENDNYDHGLFSSND